MEQISLSFHFLLSYIYFPLQSCSHELVNFFTLIMFPWFGPLRQHLGALVHVLLVLSKLACIFVFHSFHESKMTTSNLYMSLSFFLFLTSGWSNHLISHMNWSFQEPFPNHNLIKIWQKLRMQQALNTIHWLSLESIFWLHTRTWLQLHNFYRCFFFFSLLLFLQTSTQLEYKFPYSNFESSMFFHSKISSAK